jgi:dihydropteroate synthase
VNKSLNIGEGTVICGILNLTPDSFSDDGIYYDRKKAVDRVKQMADEGAGMIDIGGESSRPGAVPVPLEEERKRILPVLEEIAGKIDIPVSIDTYKSVIAGEALQTGADIVNDITSLQGDPDMGNVIAESGAGIILMHMQGKPHNMQENPYYKDVVSDIIEFLKDAVGRAGSFGISTEKIIVDPGIGFGKRTEHNLEIIKKLAEMKSLGRPILIGVSRKSVIGNVLNLPVNERIEGTEALVACAILKGADIVRVHDVKQMYRVSRMVDAVKKGIEYA